MTVRAFLLFIWGGNCTSLASAPSASQCRPSPCIRARAAPRAGSGASAVRLGATPQPLSFPQKSTDDLPLTSGYRTQLDEGLLSDLDYTE